MTAVLSGASLDGSDLVGANLSDAIGVDLVGARWDETTLGIDPEGTR